MKTQTKEDINLNKIPQGAVRIRDTSNYSQFNISSPCALFSPHAFTRQYQFKFIAGLQLYKTTSRAQTSQWKTT